MRYKEALLDLDKNTRICILHLEKLIKEKYISVLSNIPKQVKLNIQEINIKMDRHQKQFEDIKKYKKELKEAEKDMRELLSRILDNMNLLDSHEDLYIKMVKVAQGVNDDIKQMNRIYRELRYKE